LADTAVVVLIAGQVSMTFTFDVDVVVGAALLDTMIFGGGGSYK